jgi:hypothetical protein
MTKISSSSGYSRVRNHFDEGEEPVERAWAEFDLEYDLRTTYWILEKVRESESYAQNLYAAMCNNTFQKIEVVPILKNEIWSCSWRHAGSIIADMREQGVYLDWYCSGMGGVIVGNMLTTLDEEQAILDEYGHVTEGCITKEIREDLNKLGWAAVTVKKDD